MVIGPAVVSPPTKATPCASASRSSPAENSSSHAASARRQGQRQRRPARRRAHGRQVAQVDREGAMTDGARRTAVRKVPALHQGVHCRDEVRVLRKAQHGGIIADAQHDVGPRGRRAGAGEIAVDQLELAQRPFVARRPHIPPGASPWPRDPRPRSRTCGRPSHRIVWPAERLRRAPPGTAAQDAIRARGDRATGLHARRDRGPEAESRRSPPTGRPMPRCWAQSPQPARGNIPGRRARPPDPRRTRRWVSSQGRGLICS